MRFVRFDLRLFREDLVLLVHGEQEFACRSPTFRLKQVCNIFGGGIHYLDSSAEDSVSPGRVDQEDVFDMSLH